jgi:hypothetical protein
VIVASDGLAFLLVAGLTAIILFVAAALALWLIGEVRRRRHSAEARPPAAGPAQLGD